jgi:large subunit ribosomal protein L35
VLIQHAQIEQNPASRAFAVAAAAKESQMPKIKTKSGAKKRFKVTAGGKVLYAHRGKRHGMIKRTNKQIRQLRGTAVLFKTDGDNIKKYFLPNG